MQFILFPMIHLGTPGFYRTILTRLGSCQLIVAEGVRGKTAAGSLLMLSYRMLGRSGKLGLVAQNLDLDALGVPVIRPDMTGEEFEKRWHQAVPVLHRLLLWLVAPLFAIGMLLFGTRRMLGRHLAVDDLPTVEQERARESFEHVDRLVVDERDALLAASLVSIHGEHASEPISIGVVYGAGHMPAVAAALLAQCGYRARSAEWVTVFGF